MVNIFWTKFIQIEDGIEYTVSIDKFYNSDIIWVFIRNDESSVGFKYTDIIYGGFRMFPNRHVNTAIQVGKEKIKLSHTSADYVYRVCKNLIFM